MIKNIVQHSGSTKQDTKYLNRPFNSKSQRESISNNLSAINPLPNKFRGAFSKPFKEIRNQLKKQNSSEFVRKEIT